MKELYVIFTWTEWDARTNEPIRYVVPIPATSAMLADGLYNTSQGRTILAHMSLPSVVFRDIHTEELTYERAEALSRGKLI